MAGMSPRPNASYMPFTISVFSCSAIIPLLLKISCALRRSLRLELLPLVRIESFVGHES